MNISRFLLLTVCLITAGCATPPEVKQLSVNQIEYFNQTIAMLSIQSEALLLASKNIADRKLKNIEDRTRKNTEIFQRQIAAQLTPEQVQTLYSKMLETQKIDDENVARLESALTQIETKSAELQSYVKAMKKVHIVLDSYIQSEKAGEAKLYELFKLYSVNDLFTHITDFTQKASTAMQSLESEIRQIQDM